MAAADPSDGHAPGESVAAACREAGLVRLVATSDGDALAATGVLARALSATGIPFQASVHPFPAETRGDGTDADATVTVGAPGGDVALDGHPASPAAYAAARDIAPDAADPTLALAGVLAAGAAPGDDPTTLADDATAAGCDRRPGVGVPTADLADGLAHTTLVHTPDSGDIEAYRAALAERDLPTERTGDTSEDDTAAGEAREDAGRRLASLLAFDAVRSGEAPPRAADAAERALRPHAGARCPFATVEGYADVLDATARRAPGTGVALALGHDAREAALDAWREHASAAHHALRAADTSRYDGCVAVVTRTGPVETVARLVRDFRSPEPAVLVIGDGEAAAAGDGVDVGEPLRATAAAGGPSGGRASSDGSGGGTSHARGETAYARLDTSDPTGLLDAFREELA
ncbi:exonuclease RecJ [Haloglomus halophilum]|uniref:exonuclease RecJ n=1 Tax=Haloglomus halophilum TaxID=2962672 RepID=UPI0020C9990F|nr:exonuclease RecJ [Haloglomus halophilum]